MSKINGGKFHLAWDAPTDKDVAGYVLFFSADPATLGYDSPSVSTPGPEFVYPDMDPGFAIPSDGAQTFVAVAAKDAAGNLSDLVTLAVPFDVTPPGPVANLRLI